MQVTAITYFNVFSEQDTYAQSLMDICYANHVIWSNQEVPGKQPTGCLSQPLNLTKYKTLPPHLLPQCSLGDV